MSCTCFPTCWGLTLLPPNYHPVLDKAYEAESYATLTKAIEEQTALPKPVFTSLLKKIYKRSK